MTKFPQVPENFKKFLPSLPCKCSCHFSQKVGDVPKCFLESFLVPQSVFEYLFNIRIFRCSTSVMIVPLMCTGVISGALLQLRTEFDLNCQQTEIVVSALLIGALISSLSGGICLHLSFSLCLPVSLSDCLCRPRSELGRGSLRWVKHAGRVACVMVPGSKTFQPFCCLHNWESVHRLTNRSHSFRTNQCSLLREP